jgi:hypothetical protein
VIIIGKDDKKRFFLDRGILFGKFFNGFRSHIKAMMARITIAHNSQSAGP